MTVAKLALFALFVLFAAILGLLSLNQARTMATPAFAAPSLVMQSDCPDGEVWSEEENRCVPRPPRGSY